MSNNSVAEKVGKTDAAACQVPVLPPLGQVPGKLHFPQCQNNNKSILITGLF